MTAIGALLYFAAGFSGPQSVILALAFVILYQVNGAKSTIRPFSVLVRPTPAVLDDTDLFKLEKPEGNSEGIGSNNRSGFFDGIEFTVLQPNLIYSNDHHTFFSDSDLRDHGIRKPINELSFSTTDLFERNVFPESLSPLFYVRSTKTGYEIGVVTPESFKNAVERRGSDLVPLATLPHEVFWPYYQPPTISTWESRWERRQKRIDARLRDFSWTEELQEGGRGFCYQHKYADVYVREIG